ncbi:MAG: hypothetical protein ACXABY_36150 [Candidatus Thorarchaeota archaeon]
MSKKIHRVEVTFLDSPYRYRWDLTNPKTTMKEVIEFLKEEEEKEGGGC